MAVPVAGARDEMGPVVGTGPDRARGEAGRPNRPGGPGGSRWQAAVDRRKGRDIGYASIFVKSLLPLP